MNKLIPCPLGGDRQYYYQRFPGTRCREMLAHFLVVPQGPEHVHQGVQPVGWIAQKVIEEKGFYRIERVSQLVLEPIGSKQWHS